MKFRDDRHFLEFQFDFSCVVSEFDSYEKYIISCERCAFNSFTTAFNQTQTTIYGPSGDELESNYWMPI